MLVESDMSVKPVSSTIRWHVKVQTFAAMLTLYS